MDNLNRAFQRVCISVHAYVNRVKVAGEGIIPKWCGVCLNLRELWYLTDRRILLYMQDNPSIGHVSFTTQADMVEALCEHVIKHFQGSVDLFFSKYPIELVAGYLCCLATDSAYINLESSDAVCQTLISFLPAR